jgi:hypothetical protein
MSAVLSKDVSGIMISFDERIQSIEIWDVHVSAGGESRSPNSSKDYYENTLIQCLVF